MEKDYIKIIKTKVKPIEVPPFLFTRIEAKIQKEEGLKLPFTWRLVAGVVFVVVFALNIYTFNSTQNNSSDTLSEFSDVMNIDVSNHLYYE